MEIQIKKLKSNAIIPTYKHVDENGNPNDMGMDITCIEYEYDSKYDRFIYHTGLAFKLPQGYGMLIFPRSSNTKTDAYLPNSVGILDSTYVGELTFAYKLRDYQRKDGKDILNIAPYNVGDKIGQIVIIPFPSISFKEVKELPQTDRGCDGGINRLDNNFKI